MYKYVCKSFALQQTIRSSQTQQRFSLVRKTPLVLSQSLAHISNVSKQEHTFAVPYLIDTCGFSPESALLASKHVKFKTLDKPNAVIDFLGNHGFSKTQITKIIKIRPTVLQTNFDKTLLPKIQFFTSKGVSIADITKMLTVQPNIMFRSLEHQIIPVFDFISNLLLSNAKTLGVIKSAPDLLCSRLEALESNINILRENGVRESDIRLFLQIGVRSGYIKKNLEWMEEAVARVKEMGISPLKCQFVLAVKVLCQRSKFTWQRKVEVYKQWGFSEEEIMAAFCNYPWFMAVSEDKIMAFKDFSANVMGWDHSRIAKQPRLITISLKKRAIPRAALYHFLLSKGALKKEYSAFFMCSDSCFIRKFVNSYAEAPELLKVYNEKLRVS